MSRRHTSASKRTAKPAHVTRTKQSFDDQLRRISDEKEDNSLIIPFSLLVIASYLNRLHFKEIINERLRWDPAQWKYSPGVLAQIMVLSVFVPSRKKVALSRIHEAFAGIDLTYLVGESIDPESLNDDLFGQLLDRIYEYGCSTLYRSISLTVRTTFDLPPNTYLHSDTTSHVLTGEYECSQPQEISTVIRPTYGVSKEKRADLKQIMSGSVTDGDGLVLFCQILDGNTADCEYNNLMLSALQSVYGDEFGEYTYIADCKVLTEKNLNLIYKGASVEVKAGNEAVTETLSVFNEIVKAIDVVHNNMTEVAGATEEQAAAVEEITASVHEVESLVQQTAKEAVDSAAATQEVTASIDQITKAISDAAASVQNISTQMGKFTVS